MTRSNHLPATDAARDPTGGGEVPGGTVRLGRPKPAAPTPDGPPRSGVFAGPHVGASELRATPFPEAGDELFGYLVRGELGRGAFARVYLAEQADLAGRPVVLKVSAIDTCTR